MVTVSANNHISTVPISGQHPSTSIKVYERVYPGSVLRVGQGPRLPQSEVWPPTCPQMKFWMSVTVHQDWKFGGYVYWFYVKNYTHLYIWPTKIFKWPRPPSKIPAPCTASSSPKVGVQDRPWTYHYPIENTDSISHTSSAKSSGSANGGCSSACFRPSSWPWKKFYNIHTQ